MRDFISIFLATLLLMLSGVSPALGNVSIRERSSLKSGTFNNANQLTAEAGGGKVRITGSINKLGASVSVAGQAAAVHPQGGFAVEVQAAPGANRFPLVVTEADGTVTNKYVDLLVENSVPVIHRYDANGNLESVAPQAAPTSPTRTYQWDAANRLVGITRILSPTVSRKTEFLYNGMGARVGKKELLNGAVESDIRYFYGGTGVLQERSADGGTVTKTYTSRGELDYSTSPATPRYYTRDHLGSVREVVAEDGTLVARYDYKPYGERVVVSGTYQAAKGYTGHDYHADSGLILTLFRAYDPGTGRWLSPDPIGEAGGLNLYGYGPGDPMGGMDPLGADWHHLVVYTLGRDNGLTESFLNATSNGWEISNENHRKLHSAGWIKDWDKFFKCNPNPSTKDVTAQLMKMMGDSKYQKWLDKGAQATNDYPPKLASNRASKYAKRVFTKKVGSGLAALAVTTGVIGANSAKYNFMFYATAYVQGGDDIDKITAIAIVLEATNAAAAGRIEPALEASRQNYMETTNP